MIIACAVALSATVQAQTTKPQERKPAVTNERGTDDAQRAREKEREAAKARQQNADRSDIASPTGRPVARPGTTDPQTEAKQKQLEEDRIKAERERAQRQRQEALSRGGNAAGDRTRVESAGQKVDRASLDPKEVTKEREMKQKDAEQAIERLTKQTTELTNRITQLKNAVRAREAAGATQEELAPEYDRIKRLSALLNSAQGELRFLMSVTQPKQGAPERTEERKPSR